jgi:hypothetical protein
MPNLSSVRTAVCFTVRKRTQRMSAQRSVRSREPYSSANAHSHWFAHDPVWDTSGPGTSAIHRTRKSVMNPLRKPRRRMLRVSTSYDPTDHSCGHDGLPCAERRMKSLMVIHAFDFMHRHPAFDRYRESYPRRSELHQNYYSGDGDEQSAVPDGV